MGGFSVNIPTGRAVARGVALALAAALAVPVTAAVPAQAATTASITIADPGAVVAGGVTLAGAVSRSNSPGDTTSVLIAMDASGSSRTPNGKDCNGDGRADPVGPQSPDDDDLNNDTAFGDLLDCEIGAAIALNGSLAASPVPNVQVGLMAFDENPALADLDPGPADVRFVAPATAGEPGETMLQTVAKSVLREKIRKYTERELPGENTNFNNAVLGAIGAFTGQPAGPKYVLFLSDGESAVSQETIDHLKASGVQLRTFAVDGAAGCEAASSLSELAGATGETCTNVDNPRNLAASLVSGISAVTVTVGGVTANATVDAVGGWKAAFRLGAGTFTATARATLANGATAQTTRTFRVAAPPPGSAAAAAAPAPGSVAPAAGTLLATTVRVRRPKNSRFAVPATVSGSVAPFGATGTTHQLDAARVVLQGRGGSGAAWVRLAAASVRSGGTYTITWKRTQAIKFLRVVLTPTGKYASSVSLVPAARISSCKATRSGAVRTMTCKTTAANGTKARLLASGSVADRARVRNGKVAVTRRGSFSGTVLSVDVSAKRHYTLRF